MSDSHFSCPTVREYRDPELSVVVDRISIALSARAQKGDPLAAYCADTGSFDEKTLYALAFHMCKDGEYANALPIALHLATAFAGKSRYAFIAATCLQRLGQPQAAFAWFIAAGSTGDPGPAVWFRAAECLESMGQREPALDLLGIVVELCREDAAYSDLQHAADQKANQLRAS